MIYISELKHTIEKFSITNDINKEIESLEDIYKIFKCLYEKGREGDAYALRILNYIYSNLCDEARIKRKVTARDFEDLLASLINGIVLDEETRTNDKDANESNFENYISSNYREKADILVENTGYKLSVKTLTMDNDEVNCGSFAREALFNGALESSDYGSERKGGLGSKGQFHTTLEKIKEDKLDIFKQNFETMLEGIFKDDIIFFIKDSNFLNIYFLRAQSFNEILKESLDMNLETFVSIVNRYEGNSIRTERDVFLAKCIEDQYSYHINIDFNSINHKIFSKIDSILLHIKDQLTDAINSGGNTECIKSTIEKISLQELTINENTVESPENIFHKQLVTLVDKGYFNLGPVIFNMKKEGKKEKKYSTAVTFVDTDKVSLKLFNSSKDIVLDTSEIDVLKINKNTSFMLEQVQSPYAIKKKIDLIHSSDENIKIIVASGFTKKLKSILVLKDKKYIYTNENKLIEKEKFEDKSIDLEKALQLVNKERGI